MNRLFLIIFLFVQLIGFSQEALEPLKTNFALIDLKNNQKSVPVNANDYIFLLDTINLPVIDDFSTNKFKNYIVDTSINNISDSSWYALYDLNGNLIPDSITYMSSPTFRYVYDSVTNSNGTDTLLEFSFENDPDTIIVFDLNFHPVTFDTVIVWPNITYIDSAWTTVDPDLSYADQQPNYSQDSLTLYFVFPGANDFEKIWSDQEVYLNDNYAINPWTIGVATFDGLNENGYPHDWSSPSAVDWSDELTSKPIFLASNDISDSLYISFFYQSGGRGDAPESDDSLVLEFYVPSLNYWWSVWSTNGFTSDDWFYQHIPLDTALFFQDGFRFRFRSYGNLTGSFDHWNLDYVYLNENRSAADTLMNDWAFTIPPKTILNNFTSIPWKHYKQVIPNIHVNNVIIPSYNSSSSPKLLQPCAMDVFYEGNLESNHPYAASVLNVPPLSYFDMLYNPGTNFQFDPTINDTFVSFDVRFYLATNTTPERLSENDTIYHKQVFENYYAYDDGSAEQAYGLVGNGAELAYRFVLPDEVGEDTLRALKIHFSPSVNDVSTEPFFIQIWEDSSGFPGSLIYTTDDFNLPEFYYPQYNLGVNGFYEYELPMLIPVSDTFYVGWKQSSSARLNIGFDKNINRNDDIFFNLGSGFENTIFDGSLMMRPVFVSAMDNVVNIPILSNSLNQIKIYPNPANSWFKVESENLLELDIYDLQGRKVFNSLVQNNTEINVNFWKKGVYLIDALMKDGEQIRKKLIVH
ncbi:MAG: T9SS type A sorting domain-containing protein [Parvicellaceae bacterium]